MPSCLAPTDPRQLLTRYVRELVLVARHGQDDHRSLFLRRYDQYLGGLAPWLTTLDSHQQIIAFSDAIRCQQGAWPQTVVAMRLAFPRWFRIRVDDPWAVWQQHADFQPRGLAIDPICLMLIDPADAAYKSEVRGSPVYLCCPHCLAAYEGRPSPSALAARY